MKGWSSEASEMIQCPVPGCGHIGTLITKAHCRIAHDLTREQIEKKYGTPRKMPFKTKRGIY